MSVPTGRRIPPKGYQRLVVGVLKVLGGTIALGSIVVLVTAHEQLLLGALNGLLGLCVFGLGVLLKRLWEKRERAARGSA